MGNKMGKADKMSSMQMGLTLLFVVSLLISNIITSKQVLLPFNITMTGAVFIFPVTYILSDVFSEVYGYKWSRVTCYLGFIFNLYMVVIFTFVIKTPAPDYWDNQEAFEVVLGNTPRILVSSLIAFIVGDLVNDRIFEKMKKRHPSNHVGFGARAILSSLGGELVDSLIFLPLAFYGQMPVKTLATMTVMQVLIKTGYEVVILPVTRAVVSIVSKKEKELAGEL